jgi:outer membrane protein
MIPRNFILTFIISLFLVAGHAQTQKFGHLNSQLLLSQLSEIKAADSELEVYQNQLMTAGQEKVKSFEANYEAYLKEVNAGTLSKVQMAGREETLGKEQQGIADYEKEVQLKVLQKREELLQPILNRVDEVIKEIGKEGAYIFIFDTSAPGTMLYAPESDDLLEEVKSRLGTQ